MNYIQVENKTFSNVKAIFSIMAPSVESVSSNKLNSVQSPKILCNKLCNAIVLHSILSHLNLLGHIMRKVHLQNLILTRLTKARMAGGKVNKLSNEFYTNGCQSRY